MPRSRPMKRQQRRRRPTVAALLATVATGLLLTTSWPATAWAVTCANPVTLFSGTGPLSSAGSSATAQVLMNAETVIVPPGATEVTLSFAQQRSGFATGVAARVQISTDEAATWQDVARWTDNSTKSTSTALELGGRVVAGRGLRFRFLLEKPSGSGATWNVQSIVLKACVQAGCSAPVVFSGLKTAGRGAVAHDEASRDTLINYQGSWITHPLRLYLDGPYQSIDDRILYDRTTGKPDPIDPAPSTYAAAATAVPGALGLGGDLWMNFTGFSLNVSSAVDYFLTGTNLYSFREHRIYRGGTVLIRHLVSGTPVTVARLENATVSMMIHFYTGQIRVVLDGQLAAGSLPLTGVWLIESSDPIRNDSQAGDAERFGYFSMTGGFDFDSCQYSNSAPVLVNPGARVDRELDSISLQVSATDQDGNPLRYGASGLPPGLAIDSTTGLISGQLPSGSAGSYNVTVTITDGAAEVSATVTWQVLLPNTAPTAVDDNVSTNQYTPVTFSVLGNDSDADGDSLSVSAVTTPAHGSVTINGDQTLTYMPAGGFFGTDTFGYTVADGQGGTATGTVTVVVTQTIFTCKHLPGYWRHQAQWPVEKLRLGAATYSRAGLVALLSMPGRGDASIILARQLITAKLNIADGADGSPVAQTIANADAWLSTFQSMLPYGVPARDAQDALAWARELDLYNGSPPQCVTE